MVSPIKTTERLILRQWVDTDIQPFIQMNKDPEVMGYFPRTLSGEETIDLYNRINLHFDIKGFGLMAVEHIATGNFIGFTGFATPRFDAFFTPCTEIGWRFKKEFWGQGLATEAAKACLQYGFDELQLNKIVSFTATINKPSENVMKRIGMQYVGEFDHPNIDEGHLLCRHLLYQITPVDFNCPQP